MLANADAKTCDRKGCLPRGQRRTTYSQGQWTTLSGRRRQLGLWLCRRWAAGCLYFFYLSLFFIRHIFVFGHFFIGQVFMLRWPSCGVGWIPLLLPMEGLGPLAMRSYLFNFATNIFSIIYKVHKEGHKLWFIILMLLGPHAMHSLLFNFTTNIFSIIIYELRSLWQRVMTLMLSNLIDMCIGGSSLVLKIPSEMEVAPPHKRFSQFSALIKL